MVGRCTAVVLCSRSVLYCWVVSLLSIQATQATDSILLSIMDSLARRNSYLVSGSALASLHFHQFNALFPLSSGGIIGTF